MNSQQRGKEFEEVIKKLYKEIAQNERINAKVETRVPIIGIDGASNEIDVIYSYEHLGMKYSVAIECKNWNKPINVEELRNFYYKLKDIGNINGIFISANSGYQKGAKKVSEYNGIKLIKYSDFNAFISGEYEDYLSPDFKIIGDPFWMLVNSCGKNSIQQDLISGNSILLFESKKIVEKYKEINNYDDTLKIVGVSQNHLKEIIELEKRKEIQVKLCNPYSFIYQNEVFNFMDVNSNVLQMYLR